MNNSLEVLESNWWEEVAQNAKSLHRYECKDNGPCLPSQWTEGYMEQEVQEAKKDSERTKGSKQVAR